MGSRAVGIWLAIQARAAKLAWPFVNHPARPQGFAEEAPAKQAEYEYIATLEERIEALEEQIRECNPGLPPVDRNFRHG